MPKSKQAKKIIIVGGVAGGASCAARLRRMDEHAEIIMFERGEFISFANCGLPYYIGNVIKEKDKLLVESPEKMKQNFNLDVRIFSEVLRIDRENKHVEIRDLRNNNIYLESYDTLVLSPGAHPLRPPILGINLSQIFTLRNIPDTVAIKNFVDQNHPKHAVVVGAGYIGLEMAENLQHQGVKVTINELADQVMSAVDFEMASYIHQHLKTKGIELYLSDGVKSFDQKTPEIITVTLQSGKTIDTNLVIFGIGVSPENKLAVDAGLEIGERKGIKVDKSLRTSDPDIYAIGDAIEVMDFINGNYATIPLAGPANKQGRIVANNICGEDETYDGTQGTAILKVFDLTVGTTGNNEKLLKRFNIPYVKSYTQNSSHAGYYPGAIPMAIKLLFSPDDGKILGAQIVGYEGVDKRIDVLATAVRARMTVYDLQKLELAYAPPYSSAKDPVNIAGFVASNILKGDMDVVYWDDIDELDTSKTFLLDVRTDLEVKLGMLEGATHIPLSELRDRLDEIPRDKTIIIYCQAGQRGYYAARALIGEGFKVKNLSGGYKAYKIVTEKQSNEGIFDDLSVKLNDIIHASPTKGNLGAGGYSDSTIELDACGLACPGPIMKVADNIKTLNVGEILKVVATDPGFYNDIKVWAKQTGHDLVDISQDKGQIVAYLKKSQIKTQASPLIGSLPDGKTMVIFSGDLDRALAAFIIANGAKAMGKDVTLFFTFWGLNIIRKQEKVKTKKKFIEKLFGKMMPRGANELTLSRMNMGGMGTKMIKKVMDQHNVSSLNTLIEAAVKSGVRLVACQMSMDLMGIKQEELLEGVEIGGVATFLGSTDEANMTLFI